MNDVPISVKDVAISNENVAILHKYRSTEYQVAIY